MFSESTQQIGSSINDFSRPLETSQGGGVFIDQGVIGASKWEETLARTEEEGIEFGFVVARKKDGQFITSRIIAGTNVSFALPLWPFGIMGILQGLKEKVIVHSHHMDSRLDHLARSVITDADIGAFIKSPLKGYVILDRGGVHLLAFIREPFGKIEVDSNLVAKAVNEAAKNKGGTMDAMKIIAADLKRAGIGYYYRDTTETPPQGPIEFKSLV